MGCETQTHGIEASGEKSLLARAAGGSLKWSEFLWRSLDESETLGTTIADASNATDSFLSWRFPDGLGAVVEDLSFELRGCGMRNTGSRPRPGLAVARLARTSMLRSKLVF